MEFIPDCAQAVQKMLMAQLPADLRTQLERLDQLSANMLKNGQQPGEDPAILSSYDDVYRHPAYVALESRLQTARMENNLQLS